MMAPSLSAKLNDLVRFDGLRSGATFREEKRQQVLKCVGVRRVPEETALSFHGDHAFVLQLVQVVREVRRTDSKFRLNLASDHTFRVSGQKKLSNAKSRFGSDRGKHVS